MTAVRQVAWVNQSKALGRKNIPVIEKGSRRE
jgi:hypothetical protein